MSGYFKTFYLLSAVISKSCSLTLILKDGTFRPYHKPVDQIQYIHTESNHPPDIIKHVPASIENRFSNLLSTEILFKESTTHHEDNLRQSRYNKKLTYNPIDTNHQTHSKCKRKIIWFNPLLSKNISIKIGKSFLNNYNKKLLNNTDEIEES